MKKAKKPYKWAMSDDVKQSLTRFEDRMATKSLAEKETDAFIAKKNVESDNSGEGGIKMVEKDLTPLERFMLEVGDKDIICTGCSKRYNIGNATTLTPRKGEAKRTCPHCGQWETSRFPLT